MDEYIEREAAIRALTLHDCDSARAKMAICDLPAADVAPVQHGWWNDGDPYCPICKKDKFRGLDADVWADWKPDYCPNCGAKMDGGIN